MSVPQNQPYQRARFGLSIKLITMIISMIMIVEVVIYLPSVANFRIRWLDDRVQVAGVAARVIETVPDAMDLTPDMINNLLKAAQAEALVVRMQDKSQLIERLDMPMPVAVVGADTRNRESLDLIVGALDVIINGSDRTMRIIGSPAGAQDIIVEVLMSEANLRQEMLTYSRNIFWLSLLVAIATAAAIFFFLNRLLVQPIGRMTQNMIAFRKTPEDANRIIVPSNRKDEVGIAERELSMMEQDIFTMLRQKQHLADLGLAVAKINHDLRNTLSAAQMLSDQVATLEDPQVQRLAPRLVTTLDRAINFAQSVLDYGRQKTVPPKFEHVDLRALIDESAIDAGVRSHPSIEFANEVPDDVVINVDPDQISRVFVNILKNAREALEVYKKAEATKRVFVRLEEQANCYQIKIGDNGPGLPPRAKENLFVAFDGSGRAGGTGLGLVIAKEITESHGGRLSYLDTQEGTTFCIELPTIKD
ncbi:HAMP domain-containing sensor histidine kinase [uncultured Maritalea sp.]|jgi:signal transduction histidine kinase|uniref:HAMP domain-containing sensor histidine kinase n=1 Tax=uncultured Maritalea sp. TaxID=757249 RepID=UPI002604EFD0|nr:HAMP domain-containing sensor histidine kinase [uncultured Maritalea sp.]